MAHDGEKRIDDDRITRYFTAESTDADPRLLGSECTECKHIEFPAKQRCPSCLGSMDSRPLSRTGRLHSFSTLRFGPPQFNPPYMVGCVDLPEDVRIFTRLDDGADYEIDQSVEVEIKPVTEDEETIELGYVFAPVEG